MTAARCGHVVDQVVFGHYEDPQKYSKHTKQYFWKLLRETDRCHLALLTAQKICTPNTVARRRAKFTRESQRDACPRSVCGTTTSLAVCE